MRPESKYTHRVIIIKKSINMGIRPKKSLGQNFLVDRNIQNKIIHACGLRKTDIVLEIGAGNGALTGLIAQAAAYVYAVEIDPTLYHGLKEKFASLPNLRLINDDILKINIMRSIVKHKKRIKVIGNIPYYITTPIIERLFDARDKIDTIFLTVQKEFATRIAAPAGSKDYGSFSCFVQYYSVPKGLFVIKRTSFWPVPKVDSCFLKFDIRRRLMLKSDDEKLFFRIIRAAFNQRRKILKNSLKDVIRSDLLKAYFSRYHVNPNSRPENLTLADFAKLAKT